VPVVLREPSDDFCNGFPGLPGGGEVIIGGGVSVVAPTPAESISP
jgi:hypothetical protein